MAVFILLLNMKWTTSLVRPKQHPSRSRPQITAWRPALDHHGIEADSAKEPTDANPKIV